MAPMISESPVLENGGCSVVTDPPKYKRPRVSAVRDFPPGCGPNAPRVDVNRIEAVSCSENGKDTDQPALDETNIDTKKENSEHLVGESSENHASINRLETTAYVLKDGDVKLTKDEHASNGLLNLPKNLESDCMPVEITTKSCSMSEALQVHTEHVTKESLHETQVPPEDPLEIKHETPAGVSNSTKGLETKVIGNSSVTEEKMVVEGNSPPHYPIPSIFVWKARNYPPRRRVSAVRTFPVGCGTSLPLNSNCLPVDAPVNDRQTVEETMGSENTTADVKTDMKEIADCVDDDVVLGGENTTVDMREIVDRVDNDVVLCAENTTADVKTDMKEIADRVDADVVLGAENTTADVVLGAENTTADVVFGAENTTADVETDMKEIANRVDDDVFLDTEMAGSDKDDLGETNIQLPEVQSPESPKEQHKMDELLSSQGVKDEQLKGKDRKDVIVYRKEKGERKRTTVYPDSDTPLQAENVVPSYPKDGLVIVQALMAAVNCPWQQGRGAVRAAPSSLDATPSSVNATPSSVKAKSSTVGGKGKRRKKCVVAKPQKSKPVFKEAMEEAEQQKEERMNKAGPSVQEPGVVGGEMVVWDEEDSPENANQPKRNRNTDVSILPFGAPSSSVRGIRSKVRETLRLFQAVLRKLLQEQETKPKEQRTVKRFDLQAAKILKNKGKYINTGKQIIGPVSGVEVGDEFHYRVELMMIGLHRQSQAGIDFVKLDNKRIIATSIVASGGYDNDVDNTDVLIFSGQGGNLTGGDKEPEDQKLERGNLALKNSIDDRNVVRVIRGVKETKTSEVSDGKPKVTTTYTYDGLYTVERYWQDLGQSGKKVYKFELKRLPDQPELAWKEVKKSKKFKHRECICVDDISEGKERFPICAINTIDDEKPPPFTYIKQMMYPDWCKPLSPQGCSCKNGCSDSSRCPCVVKNGGEIPYNFDGAIVEDKTLVFECGPTCKCPPSCHNRVSQNGVRFQLEIFKTEHRGWGVRSLYSIPSGSFICEYMGELLEDKEAEQRTGNDEYLFDIGQNYNDHSLWEGLSGLMPDVSSSSNEVVDVGFTIDAAQYGNVGRFINHSCSPNLYAQNVLYDHDDRRIPHIMFFAAENIPPLQELTYHYNYTIDQVLDKSGNIKVKDCYCGSSDCTGRLY